MNRGIVILCSLLVLGLSSCGISSVQNGSGAVISSSLIESTLKKAEKAEKELNQRSESLQEATAAERTTLRDAVMEMDAGKCESLKETKEYQRCQMVVYTSLAAKNKDISYCEKIPMKTSAEACVDSVIVQKSVSENDSKLCDSLTSDDRKATCRDNFAYSIAQNEKSAAKCEEITRDDVKKSCFDTVTLASLSIEGTEATDCVNMYNSTSKLQCETFVGDLGKAKQAIVEKQLSACDLLTDPTVKSYCSSEVNLLLAQDTKESKYCAMLSDGFALSSDRVKDYQTECRNLTVSSELAIPQE